MELRMFKMNSRKCYLCYDFPTSKVDFHVFISNKNKRKTSTAHIGLIRQLIV